MSTKRLTMDNLKRLQTKAKKTNKQPSNMTTTEPSVTGYIVFDSSSIPSWFLFFVYKIYKKKSFIRLFFYHFKQITYYVTVIPRQHGQVPMEDEPLQPSRARQVRPHRAHPLARSSRPQV